jgi:hypothetical protein
MSATMRAVAGGVFTIEEGEARRGDPVNKTGRPTSHRDQPCFMTRSRPHVNVFS